MLIILRVELTMDKFQLNLHHINVRSLVRKVDDIKFYLSTNRCDVLAISETWLDGKIKTTNVNINGYKFIRRDRDS